MEILVERRAHVTVVSVLAHHNETSRMASPTPGARQARPFGEERLITLLGGHTGSAADILGNVEKSLDAHTGGAEPFDDVTMLAVARAL